MSSSNAVLVGVHGDEPGSDGVILVYTLIILNFVLGKIKDFSCETQSIVHDHRILYHLLNYLAMFCVVVIYTRVYPMNPWVAFVLTIAFYVLFILVTKCETSFFVCVMACMFAVFFLQAQKNYTSSQLKNPDQEESKKDAMVKSVRIMTQSQLSVGVASAMLLVLGVTAHVGEQSTEYRGKKWSWLKFWLGTAECAQNGIPMKLTLVQKLTCGVLRLFLGRSCVD